MKLPSARGMGLGGLTAALLACSTPLSFEPQVAEEEGALDAGAPSEDAGPSARPDATADARPPAADASSPLRDGGFACDVYGRSAACPAAIPASSSQCTVVPDGGLCFYESSTPGLLQVSECTSAPFGGRWSRSSEQCSYRCEAVLPPGNNFFSLLTDDCATRPVTQCRRADLRTSQQSVDRMLNEARAACGVSALMSAGITFDGQGCPDWFYYEAGQRLPSGQIACLSERLEALRIDCSARCALADKVVP